MLIKESTERPRGVPKGAFDNIDLQAQIGRRFLGRGLGDIPIGILGIAYLYADYRSFPDDPTALAASVAAVTSGLLYLRNHGARADKISDWYNKNLAATEGRKSKDRGFYINEHVYKGDLHKLKGGFLFKGDPFLIIKTPEINGYPRTPEQLAVWADFVDLTAFNIAKGLVRDGDYKAVAIQVPAFGLGIERIPGATLTNREELMAGKGINLEYPSIHLSVMTPEVFSQFDITSHHPFHQLAKKLNDPVINSYLQAVKEATTPEQVELAKKFINQRLNGILRRELEIQHNQPEVSISRDPFNHSPVRQRTHSMVQLNQKPTGLHLTKINPATSEVRSTPVDNILASNGQSYQDLLNAPYTHQVRAEIAYALSKLIPDQLLGQVRYSQPDEALAKVRTRMEKVGIAIKPLIKDEHDWVFEPSFRRSLRLKAPGLAKFIFPLLIAVATARVGASIAQKEFITQTDPKDRAHAAYHIRGVTQSALIGTGRLTRSFLPIKDSLDTVNDLLRPWITPAKPTETPKPTATPEAKKERFRPSEGDAKFHPELPTPGIEWTLAGSIDVDGYYFTNTSSQLENGNWVIDVEPEKDLDLPTVLAREIPQLRIATGAKFQVGKTITFLIPIKEKTQISAVSIQDSSGREIPRIVHQYTNGTLGAEVHGEDILSEELKITAFFTRSDHPTVKAIKPLPPIDESKLSPTAQNLVQKISSVDNADQSFKTARDLIKTKKYSMAPDHLEAVNTAMTAEEKLNAIADLDGCNCSICNAGEVLASANGKDEFLNMAFGYIAFSEHPGGRGGGYLRTESRHGFGVSDKGIIYDATPHDIADDELTQAFMRLLNHSSSGETLDTPTPTPTLAATPTSLATQTPFPTPEQADKPAATTVASVPPSTPTPISIQVPEAVIQKQPKAEQSSDNDLILAGTGALISLLGSYRTRPQSSNTSTKLIEEIPSDMPTITPVEPKPLKFNPDLFKTISSEDSRALVNFMTWVSYGRIDRPFNLGLDFAGSDDSQSSFTYLKNNTNPQNIMKYLEDPIAYEQYYQFSSAGSQFLQAVGKAIVNH